MKLPRIPAVYRITNTINAKHYYGQSGHALWRWEQHKNRLKYDEHVNAALQADFNKYGQDAFKHEVIATLPTSKERRNLELTLIKADPDCYNIAGKPLEGEHLAKKIARAWKKGHVWAKVKCPKCGVDVGENVAQRFHFDNCGKPHDVTCPYCQKVGGTGIMKRWHFDNCKHKPS